MKNIIKKLTSYLFILVFLFAAFPLLPFPSVYATSHAGIKNPATPFGTGDGAVALGSLLGTIIGWLLIIGFILTILYIILGAIKWILAGGDKQRLESAQSHITNAVIGLIILASTWAIMTLIQEFTGLSILGT